MSRFAEEGGDPGSEALAVLAVVVIRIKRAMTHEDTTSVPFIALEHLVVWI